MRKLFGRVSSGPALTVIASGLLESPSVLHTHRSPRSLLRHLQRSAHLASRRATSSTKERTMSNSTWKAPLIPSGIRRLVEPLSQRSGSAIY